MSTTGAGEAGESTAGPPGRPDPPGTPADDLHRTVRRGRVVTLVAAAVALVLLALTAAFGGFARRTDEISPAEPGEELSTGAYVLSFTSGTVQHRKRDDTWVVVVSGAGRTTADTSDDLSQGASASTFVYAQDVATRQVQVVDSWSYGPPAEEDSHARLVPGMPAVELRASFEFTVQPQGRLRLVVLDQRYGTAYVLDDEQAWQRERTGRDLAIPLTVLPEQDS